MEEKTFSERLDEFVETLRLYIVQNISEILDSSIMQPFERVRKRLVTSIIVGFIYGTAFVFLALGLFFLCVFLALRFDLSRHKELSYGLSFMVVCVILSLCGYVLSRRSAHAKGDE